MTRLSRNLRPDSKLCVVWSDHVRTGKWTGFVVTPATAQSPAVVDYKDSSSRRQGCHPLPPVPGVRVWSLTILHRPKIQQTLPTQCVVGVRLRLSFRKLGNVYTWVGTVLKIHANRALIKYDAMNYPLWYPPPANARTVVVSADFFARPPPGTAHLRQQVLRYRRAAAHVASLVTTPTVAALPGPGLGTPLPMERPNKVHSQTNRLTRVQFLRRGFRVGTFNSRTLADNARTLKLLSYATDYGIDIVCVQETRLQEPLFSGEEIYGFSVHHAPARADGHYGVATIVASTFKACRDLEILVPHRATALFGSIRNIDVCVINAYFAQRGTPEQEDMALAITKYISTLPKHVMALVAGDFNGCEYDVCNAAALQHSHAHMGLSPAKHTWTSADGRTKKVLDFVCFPKNKVTGVRKHVLCQPFPSDHRMICVTFVPRWSSIKEQEHRKSNTQRTAKAVLDKLAYDGDARERFQAHYKSTPHTSNTLGDITRHVQEVAAKMTLESPPVELVTPWDSHPSLHQQKTLKKQMSLDELDAGDIAAATKHVNEYADLLKRNPWTAWKHIDIIKRKASSCKAPITPSKFHRHFKPLMERKIFDPGGLPSIFFPDADKVRLSDRNFTLEELQRAIQTMANHTAPGPGGLPIEAFRCACVQEEILPILNQMLDTSDLPEDLILGLLTPIWKRKGDASKEASYRPVVLLEVALKILHKMMLLRIREALDPYLLPCQSAYREGLCTTMNILPLQELMERAKKTNLPLYLIFTDFTDAFSSVHRDKLFHLLRQYKVPERFVAFLERSHAQQRIRVRFSGELSSEEINPDTGVMQGDTLAPFLFILVVDQILRKSPEAKGALYDSDLKLRLPALAYADDVVLLANSKADAQSLLVLFEDAALTYGLKLNVAKGKTELMVIAHPSIIDSLDVTLFCKAGPVGLVNSYKYLGWMCSNDDKDAWRTDFKKRQRQAWFVLKQHDRVWRASIDDETKRKLFHALITPILLYASPSYPATQRAMREQHVFCNKLLRYALGKQVSWDDESRHTSTFDLYGSIPLLPITTAKHFLVQWGHWVRMAYKKNVHPCVSVLLSDLKLGKRRGRNWPPSRVLLAYCPPKTTLDDLERLPKNRGTWKKFVARSTTYLLQNFAERICSTSVGHTDPSQWTKKSITLWQKRWNL